MSGAKIIEGVHQAVAELTEQIRISVRVEALTAERQRREECEAALRYYRAHEEPSWHTKAAAYFSRYPDAGKP